MYGASAGLPQGAAFCEAENVDRKAARDGHGEDEIHAAIEVFREGL